jgi:hypothetical protein
MTQALYAHMNNKIIIITKRPTTVHMTLGFHMTLAFLPEAPLFVLSRPLLSCPSMYGEAPLFSNFILKNLGIPLNIFNSPKDLDFWTIKAGACETFCF